MSTGADSLDYEPVGLRVPNVLIPRADIPFETWAVVACDQFTSDPDYWERADRRVGANPSTLRLIVPECYLNGPDLRQRTDDAKRTMRDYLSDGVLAEAGPGFVLVERRTPTGRTRWGLVAAIDLDQYDYRPGTNPLIRPTEGTIVSRLPPRIALRDGAPIELPHVLVLFDDRQLHVLGPLISAKTELPLLYAGSLMGDAGTLRGYRVADSRSIERLAAAFGELRRGGDMLFAVGDGNHSLAAAKAVWDKVRAEAPMHDPRRYALVELVNIHDPGLTFEPIHRVLFGDGDSLEEFLSERAGVEIGKPEELTALTRAIEESTTIAGLVSRRGVRRIAFSGGALPAGVIQPALDDYLARHDRASIDYVHEIETTVRLGSVHPNAAIIMPRLSKSEFFPTVRSRGSYPRKTFSLGESLEKRFYFEARRLLD